MYLDQECKGCKWNKTCWMVFLKNHSTCPCYICLVKMSCFNLCDHRSQFYSKRKNEVKALL